MKLMKKQKCAALLLVCCILFQVTYHCVVRPNVVYATGAGGAIAGGAVAGGLGLTGPEVAVAIAALFGVAAVVDNADTIYMEMNNCINKVTDGLENQAAIVSDWWKDAAAGVVDTTSSVWKGVCNWFTGTRENYYNTAHVVNCPAGTTYKILDSSYSCATDTLAVPYFCIGEASTKYKDVHVGVAFFSNTYFKGSKDAFVSEYDSDSGLYYKFLDQGMQVPNAEIDFALKRLTNDNVSEYGDLSFCYENPYVKVKLLSYLRTLVSGGKTIDLSGGIDAAINDNVIDDAADVIWPNTIVLNPNLAADEELASVLEKLRSGELTWTDCWDRVASGERVGIKTETGTYVLDNAGVTDVPYEKDATDAPPAVNTPELNNSLADYKTDGLISLFPFCVPFDLINCIKLMAATGQAPCWEFPFRVPVLGLEDTIKIDLTKWDSVAAVCRSLETLLFVGLLINKTRTLIRG